MICQSRHTFTQVDVINGVKRIGIGSTPGYAPTMGQTTARHRRFLQKAFRWAKRDIADAYCTFVAKEKPDVIHTNVLHPVGPTLDALATLGIPIVHTLRIYHLMCKHHMYFLDRDCRVQCEPCVNRGNLRSSNQVSAVVGISRYVLQRHLDAGYFSQVRHRHVLPNSYDLDEASASRSARPRKPTGRFLFMGRIHPSKGLDLFVKLARNSPSLEFSFRVCGEGLKSYVAEVRAALEGTRTEWLGFSSHEQAFDGVDWLVVPSLWGEPFGRVVIEAFAHGVPVIATDAAAFPELIEHGKNGFLFAPGDEKALLAIARDIAEQRVDHAAMQDAARLSAMRYSSANIAIGYEKIYQEVQTSRGQ